jgi:hypothetical protein
MKHPTTNTTDEIKIEAKRIEPVVSDDHIQKMISVDTGKGEVKIVRLTPPN